ncbi:MAG: hypothetical protein HOP31_09130 [Ignavibacteria bacterium]|nr:hypothetical protein [Ignavibacteria bacterium]
MNYKVNEHLTAMVRSLSKKDIRDFRKFLRSSYLNPYPKAEILFNSLISFNPDISGSKYNRLEVFSRMKTGKQYNDSTMRDLLSKLKYLLEKYLAYCSFEKDEYDHITQLRKQLYSRRLYDQIEKNIMQAEKTIPGYNVADPDYFYKKIKVETEKFNNFVINRKLYNEQSLNDSIISLNSSAKNQLALFILESIKQNDNILKITKRQEKTKTRNVIPELLKPINLKKIIVSLKKNNSELSHIFQIYFNLYLLFSTGKGEKYFHLLKQDIIENSDKINADELHFLFGRLIDYCVNMCNDGRSEYYKELFNAYVIMLEKKYYTNSSNKYISQDLFRNIFQTSIRINNLKWAEEFIVKYRKELHPVNRDSMFYYCYAYIYFESGNFDKALEYILKIKQDYFALKIDIKILHLKIYFELGMYEQVYNQLDSFKHFITNHEQIIPGRREKIKDFLYYFERVLKAKLKEDEESVGFLHQELTKKNDRQFFNWLTQKAEKLSNTKK